MLLVFCLFYHRLVKPIDSLVIQDAKATGAPPAFLKMILYICGKISAAAALQDNIHKQGFLQIYYFRFTMSTVMIYFTNLVS